MRKGVSFPLSREQHEPQRCQELSNLWHVWRKNLSTELGLLGKKYGEKAKVFQWEEFVASPGYANRISPDAPKVYSRSVFYSVRFSKFGKLRHENAHKSPLTFLSFSQL